MNGFPLTRAKLPSAVPGAGAPAAGGGSRNCRGLIAAQYCAPSIALVMMFGAMGAEAAESTGRFVLKDGGQGVYLRLDTETGAISQCSHTGQVWSCQSVADDRAELHKEIARLKEENEALTARLNKLANHREPDRKLTLPSDADIERVLAMFQKFLDRIFAFIRSLEQKQADQRV